MNHMNKENQEERLQLEEAARVGGFGKLIKYAGLMGPAWLAIALNIGGATVTASVVLGSKTGFKFLWAIIPEVFAIWVICILFVQVTLATGEGPVSAVRRHLGAAAAWVSALSVFLVNTVFHAVQYMLIGITMKTVFGVDQRVGALAGLVFVLIIVFNPAKGRAYIKLIETTLRVLVWTLLLSFLVILFLVDIDWAAFLRGFIPSLPADADEAITFVGVLGAAIAINVPVLAAYGVKQRQWGPAYRHLSIFELTYTHIILVLVQFIIITAVASTLFKTGQVVTAPVTAAKALEPFAGGASVYLFSIGLLGAVFTTVVSQVLISGFLITDTLGWDVDAESFKFKLAECFVTLFGVTAPLFGWNAFKGVVYGSAFNLTFAPIIVVLWLVMANRQAVMGELKVSVKMNAALILAVMIALAATLNFWINLLGGG
jgi:Mn2+/Fe2+ NRAMP family transporter